MMRRMSVSTAALYYGGRAGRGKDKETRRRGDREIVVQTFLLVSVSPPLLVFALLLVLRASSSCVGGLVREHRLAGGADVVGAADGGGVRGVVQYVGRFADDVE